MSLVRICDRCKAVIETKAAIMEIQAPGVERYDLCPQCLEELRRWMENTDCHTSVSTGSQ